MKRFFLLIALLALLNESSRNWLLALRPMTAGIEPARFRIHYDPHHLRVAYGQNYRLNLWTQVEHGTLGPLNWRVTAGGLPEGLYLLPSGPQSASLTGRIQFLGQWCLGIAAENAKGREKQEENFCLSSFPQDAAPRLAPRDSDASGGAG